MVSLGKSWPALKRASVMAAFQHFPNPRQLGRCRRAMICDCVYSISCVPYPLRQAGSPGGEGHRTSLGVVRLEVLRGGGLRYVGCISY